MHHPDPGLVFAPGEQPDKVLFQKATHEISHSRYEVGRLTLQTLINTYPDSEYLSRAKLAIADSYYSEGGVSGLTQAEAEYKDFITFFPTAPEAPEAQFRVGMAHFRLMAKADRDQTEELLAEAEFKEFLLKYPDSPLISRVKRRLRQVQEILGQGEFYTANFYYTHNAFLAAQSRFQEIVEKYPNFSGGDGAYYFLGQSLEHLKRPREAVPYYSHVITDFPLSTMVPQAKERLIALSAPVPKPTRAMLARAQADASHHVERNWLDKALGVMSSAPDTSTTLFGPVHLGATNASGTETANAGAGTVPAGAAIVASPASDQSLGPANPAPAAQAGANGAASTTVDADKAKDSATATTSNQTSNPEQPTKKKKGLHSLKKIVKPF